MVNRASTEPPETSGDVRSEPASRFCMPFMFWRKPMTSTSDSSAASEGIITLTVTSPFGSMSLRVTCLKPIHEKITSKVSLGATERL